MGRGEYCPCGAPPPLSRRVTGNFLSGVICGVPFDGLTNDDLAGGEVPDADGSSRFVSVDAEHDALAPRGANLCSGSGHPKNPTVPNEMKESNVGRCPTQSSYGETPGLREIVVQQFDISQA